MRNRFEINEKPGTGGMSGRFGLAGLIVITLAAWIALDLLQRGGQPTDPSDPLRVGWYLRSAQWRADLRTLTAAVGYIMAPEKGADPQDIPAATAQWPEPPNITTVSALTIHPGCRPADLQADTTVTTQSVSFCH